MEQGERVASMQQKQILTKTEQCERGPSQSSEHKYLKSSDRLSTLWEFLRRSLVKMTTLNLPALS